MKTTPANITKTLKKSGFFQSQSHSTCVRGYQKDSAGFRTYKSGDAVKVTYITGNAITLDGDIETIDAVLRSMQNTLQVAGFSVIRNADTNFITVH